MESKNTLPSDQKEVESLIMEKWNQMTPTFKGGNYWIWKLYTKQTRI